MQIEVGYALEDRQTGVQSSGVIRNVIAPHFKARDFGPESPDLSMTERIALGAFIFGIIGLFTIIGAVTPGMGWFLYLFLIPVWTMFPIVSSSSGNW